MMTLSVTRQQKISVALTFVLIGTVVMMIPDGDVCFMMAAALGAVVALIGWMKLVLNTRGIGLAGSIVLLVAAILNGCMGLAGKLFLLGQYAEATFAPDGLSEEVAELLNPVMVNSDAVAVMANVLMVAGFVCWMLYRPFGRMRGGMVVLTVLSLLAIGRVTGAADLTDLLSVGDEVYSMAFRAAYVVGLFLTVLMFFPSRLPNPLAGKCRKAVNAVTVMVVGLLLSLFVLADAGFAGVGAGFAGAVMWIVGVTLVRLNGGRRRGTGLFVAFGVLWLVFVAVTALPVVGKAGVVVAIPAMVVLSIGFFVFGWNGIFAGERGNGAVLCGVVSVLCVMALLPVAGEVLFGVVFFPLLMVGCLMAVAACVRGNVQFLHGAGDVVQGRRCGLPVALAVTGVAVAGLVVLLCLRPSEGGGVPGNGEGEVIEEMEVPEVPEFPVVELEDMEEEVDAPEGVADGRARVMTGWKVKGLTGRVKEVIYTNGERWRFNRDGNFTGEWKGESVVEERQYVTPVRFSDTLGEFYDVVFNDSMRMEVRNEESDGWMSTDYVFDAQGRVKSEAQGDYGWSLFSRWMYDDEVSLFPARAIFEYADEEGESTTVHVYSYESVDNYGNWTRCRVEVQSEWAEWNEESEEVEKVVDVPQTIELERTIVYF